MKLADFNKLLRLCPEDQLNTFVQKHVFHGTPYVFAGREDEYFDFRNRIAQRFNVSYHEVFIVGSAKQGFSYRKKRDSFDLNSDVDVVVVSGRLFERFSLVLREYQYDLSAGIVTQTQKDFKLYQQFLRRYFTKGWVRPDCATFLMGRDPITKDWEDFFRSISYDKSEVGNYKVAGGIFKSYDYLQRYYYRGIKEHLQQLITKVS
jgi:hypothetical protein